jgi:pimeloyl-ACP methyl ester carboxylesterase
MVSMQNPSNESKEKHMSTLKVSGAQLFYEVNGSGPLLILIPGAAGTGEVFHPLAHHLSARYQVVTYDRRGFSRSQLDGPQDYEHRLVTDTDDVRCLIEHLTDQPAIVFGNSSGAIVALEVLTHSPEWVQTIVAHEPPVVFLLSMRRNGGPFSMGSTTPTARRGFLKPCTSLRAGLLEAETVR